jgi:hypothetical protein
MKLRLLHERDEQRFSKVEQAWGNDPAPPKKPHGAAMVNHHPRPGEHYGVKLLGSSATWRRYRVLGEVHGKPIEGILTLRFADGQYDGFNWQGTPMSDDEQQGVLDLFAEELD